MTIRWLRLFAVAMTLALIGTACGSTASDVVESTTDAAEEAMDDGEVGGGVDEDAAAEALEDAAGGAATSSSATSIEELQAEWDAARAVVVAELTAGIESGDYGVGDDNVLNGPGGFSVDLDNCPADWSAESGITDGTITIGHTTAQSGALAAYGNIAVGMEAYFDYVNANGGIGPDELKINLIVKDDEYVATKTQEFVDELLQSEDPFYITTLGSPNTFSVYNKLNEECVPQPLVMTGHQAWGDPENHPWTSGFQMSYATESLLWGSWIEQNLGDQAPITVSALVMDNDFGLAYEQGFDQFVESSDIIESVKFVRHDPAAATLTNEITTLAAEKADVFISMTAGNPCLLAIQEAARSGITADAKAVFTPSVCKAIASYMEPAGDAADDWYIIGGGVIDNTDAQYADDPFVAWLNNQLELAGLDTSISLYGTGFGSYGWAHVEILKVAAALPGGLNRTNLLLALTGYEGRHPFLLDGISFGVNGTEDAYFIEGSDIAQFDADAQSWIQQGGVIDLNGQSPNCAWVAGEGC